MQLTDLFATLTDRAGLPAFSPLDSRSLLPLLNDENPSDDWAERPLFWHFPIYLEAYEMGGDDSQDAAFRTRPGSALRMGNWKLIQYFEDWSIELYDLKNDPGERINLARRQPQQTRRLLTELENIRHRLKAPVPIQPNPTYEPAFMMK